MSNDRFASTHWSLVIKAGDAQHDQRCEALRQLIEIYWYPIYAFARRTGNSEDESMDLVQGFAAHLLEKNCFTSVSQEKGKFRTCLLASFRNYSANQRRAERAQKRGYGVHFQSLDVESPETRFRFEPVTHLTPEVLFQRNWIESMLRSVRHKLKEAFSAANKAELYQFIEPHLLHDADAQSHAAIAEQLQMTTAAVTMSIYRMRQTYRELLRMEIAATVGSPELLEEELKELMSVYQVAD